MFFFKYNTNNNNTDKVHQFLIQENDKLKINGTFSKCKNYLNYFNIRRHGIHLIKNKLHIKFIIFGLVYVCLYITFNLNKNIPVVHHSQGIKDYLVWDDKCKIPNIDPYDPESIKYFEKQKYDPCSTDEPWTKVKFNSTTNQYTLYVDEKLTIYYAPNLNCCYQNVVRNKTGSKADEIVTTTKCLNFNKSVQISNTTDNILVKCKNNDTQIYIHGHPMMPERAEIRDRLNSWNNSVTKRPPSILMIGIDNISRIHLLRAMPKTAQILNDNEWFEMNGYNKVGDNTFPNLMAILTGYNYTTAFDICNPQKLRKLDNCSIIWKLFQEHGYVTAFGEDEVFMSTFNYLKVGFAKPPVDYYLRPFMIAAEKYLPIRIKSGIKFCLGYLHAADYVFNYAIELATRYKAKPYFGLFWSNFAHNGFSDCSSMDLKVAEYLEKLSGYGILNESVVIFFSDHGLRYGSIRNTLSGYYEERLPFMFIWLPPWLKTKYPEFVNALIANKNRLTNPYDIHMTLKNLLELSGRTTKNLPKATGCPNCQSLLTPVPYNRSCQDIAVADHWCTCVAYQRIDINSDESFILAIFVVDYINNYLKTSNDYNTSNLCETLKLHKIVNVFQSNFISNNNPNIRLYRLLLRTLPGNANFEATIRRKIDTEELFLIGSISRLNSYGLDSNCISDDKARNYCHCPKPQSIFWRLMSYFYK